MRTSSERRAEHGALRATSAVPSAMSAVPSAEGGPRERVALGTLDFTVAATRRVGHSRLHRGGYISRRGPRRAGACTVAVTSLDGAQGERVYEYES